MLDKLSHLLDLSENEKHRNAFLTSIRCAAPTYQYNGNIYQITPAMKWYSTLYRYCFFVIAFSLILFWQPFLINKTVTVLVKATIIIMIAGAAEKLCMRLFISEAQKHIVGQDQTKEDA
ncbi:hypothetical protein SDC9_124107 [bioreactor metagenome]|uniref:Uncharacterized protein n=1 Tax=bioreactor metagenome TaxID=1076179 RepID=A0A645CJH9_9ZZZZ